MSVTHKVFITTYDNHLVVQAQFKNQNSSVRNQDNIINTFSIIVIIL